MLTKFFTFLLLTVSFTSFGQGLFLKNIENGTEKPILLHKDIDFELYSDSSLTVDFTDDGKLLSYGDSSLVLQEGREIEFSDIKSISLYPKNRQKQKAYAAPFLIAGIAALGKGVFMLSFEGLKSKNKIQVPLYLGIGTVVTGIASLPFWGRKKKYEMSRWGFVLK